jgi:deoxyribodipyrimidine photolyase-related protein
MVSDLHLILPVHLFSFSHLPKAKTYYLIEEPRYFTDFSFHRLKLAYHRATLKSYQAMLQKRGKKCVYVEYHEVGPGFYTHLEKTPKKKITVYDPIDHPLSTKLRKAGIEVLDTPNFTFTASEVEPHFGDFFKKRWNFMNFYKWQRTRLGLLMNADGKTPRGGKWSFDKENRKPLPASVAIPNPPKPLTANRFVQEAIRYTEKHFPKNYGSLDHFVYPIDHAGAQKWLAKFLRERFPKFGEYEDAMSNRDAFLFHSVLSPMMNIGLLTDREVIEAFAKCVKRSSKVPLAGQEGFIRQVIGWRNYVYMIYLFEPRIGRAKCRGNFLKAKAPLPYRAFWEGTTGLEPVDHAIGMIQKYAYVHHIYRLMVLGNVMLLMGIRPDDVYRIFMEWTIDAYDWVMMPNVYGMSQHADGGLMMTRPYFSSSNYILQMSDDHFGSKGAKGRSDATGGVVEKRGEWTAIWDGLYGAFIEKHQKYLRKGYATSALVTFWQKRKIKDRKEILAKARAWRK